MVTKIKVPQEQRIFRRDYDGLLGVDYSSEMTAISPKRSPDAKNIYRDYANTSAGGAIETRPGFELLGEASGKIYGIHIIGDKALIHHGDKLALAVGFPEQISAFTDFARVTMAQKRSVSLLFKGKLLIFDSLNYLCYENDTLCEAAASAFVPTTSISASPDGGGREYYQDVNLLSDYRINTFRADGVSTTYKLDVASFDSNTTPEVSVSGQQMTSGFTFDSSAGTVSFTEAPEEADYSGGDNVAIKFKKTVSGSKAKITHCSLAEIFDNRLFLSGNEDEKGIIFHSELEDPFYFAEESRYDDGSDSAPVSALVAMGENLAVIKEEKREGVKVYLHTPSLEHEAGKIYPLISTGVEIGAKGGGVLFGGEVIYRSSLGFEGLTSSGGEAKVYHRSYFVDPLLYPLRETAESYALWKGYLMILIGGKIFLGDNRQGFGGEKYEWFYWDNIGITENNTFSAACTLKEYGGELFFGCEGGQICRFTGTNDNGEAIMSYWTTPEDIFAQPARVKNIGKRGAGASVKRVPNSIFKVAVSTDKESFENVYSGVTRGFSFVGLNFGEFTFGTGVRGYVAFSVRKNNIRHLRLKFYSDELDKPFGIYGAWVEYGVGRYVK